MPKYTSQEEDDEIKREYAAGTLPDGRRATYRNIAEKHCISKSSVINIVLGYPYGGIKGHRAGKSGSPDYFQRVYKSLQGNLEPFMGRVESERVRAIENGNTGLLDALAGIGAMVADAMTMPAKDAHEVLKAEKLSAEHDGWRTLSESNMTGFQSARVRWRLIAEVLGEPGRDPWADLIDCKSARHKAASLRFDGVGRVRTKLTNEPQNPAMPHKQMDTATWTNIKTIIRNQTRPKGRRGTDGRWGKERRAMAGIIEALCCGLSIRQLVEKGFGAFGTLSRYYRYWFASGVFREMRDMAVDGSDLHDILPELDELERYRIAVDAEIPPRLQDVKRRANRKRA